MVYNENMKFSTWRELVEDQAEQPYFRALMNRVDAEREKYDVYPARQDPYHGPGQAHGMSFSVKPGVKLPPSLQNIFKELVDDIGGDMPTSGFLEPWGKQGVLMMNTSWSVRRGQAGSHAGYGWMEFSENLLKMLNNYDQPLVFILWGAHAQKVGQVITNPKHLKIASAHPSPFSAHRGFFGSRPFSRANEFLVRQGREVIDWRLP